MNKDNSNNFLSDLSKNEIVFKSKDEKLTLDDNVTLQLCNDNINDFSKNNFKFDEKNLKIINKELDMTINKLINTICEKRKNNVNRKDSTLINSLDEKRDLSSCQLTIFNGFEKNVTKFDKIIENNNRLDFLFNNNDNPFLQTYKGNQYHNDTFKLPPPNPIVEIKKKKINIKIEINNLKDIIKLIEKYPLSFDVEYNINMKAMHNIKEPIIELDNMIGMNKLKDSIIDQIIFFIQNLHVHNSNNKNIDFMHTCIYGPPGTGKTEIAKIIGKIFSKLGVLKKGTFKKATRADFIAGYLGQTALKTKDIIKECLGGVLFIDEAYALGNPEKRDSFAKECIDTLCEALSDNKDNLMVIIAGYKEDLKKCFFNYNQGLDSRFTWRFTTDDYSPEELKLIFIKKVKDIGWSVKNTIKTRWFENNKDYFKYYGRDMETLLAKVKIAHSRRVFCLDDKQKRIISLKDLNKGFDLFIDNDEVQNRKDQHNFNSMYV